LGTDRIERNAPIRERKIVAFFWLRVYNYPAAKALTAFGVAPNPAMGRIAPKQGPYHFRT
jgi:hypothetical protein